MKTLKLTFPFAVMLMVIIAGGCTSQPNNTPDNPDNSGGTDNSKQSPNFVFSQDEFKFTLKGGYAMFDVQNGGDQNWTVESDQSWLNISPKKAKGIFTVANIRVDEGYEGVGILTFRDKKGVRKVKVTRSNYTTPEEDDGEGISDHGRLPGIFSVGPSKRVHFSQGNLQYQASSNTYRFATHQQDIVGDDNMGNVYVGGEKSNNDDASSTYGGWIDLFGWGTGDEPWKAIKDVNEYYIYNEWGNYDIYRASNSPRWRTLGVGEWQYLLLNRMDAPQKMGVCRIDNVLHVANPDWYEIYGFVLLPDNWIQPAGTSFRSILETGWTWQDYALYGSTKGLYFSENSHNNDNIYTRAQWRKMEAAGAVFLPFNGSLVAPSRGYWTASATAYITYCYEAFFSLREIEPADSTQRYNKLAVRLVQDIQ